MNIPIGRDYTFIVNVMEPDSFLALDVTGYTGTMNVYTKADETNVITTTLTPVVGEEAQGLMEATILAADTAGITLNKGAACDGYYVKSEHKGFISITKTGAVDINVTVNDIRLIPTGA